jgi:hypothetical protein
VTAKPWLEMLDEALDACLLHGRPDLAQRLRVRRDPTSDGTRLVFLGLAKQGKSYLVNAMINAPVCTVGDASSTAVPTEIRYASSASAVLIRRSPSAAGAEERATVPVEQVAAEVARRPSAPGGLLRAEVFVPRELLASGLVVIDTPAVGNPGSTATATALEVLAGAHAAVLVTDATGELSPAELGLARHVATWCPSLAVVLTKTDSCPEWRSVAERDRVLLATAGVDVPVLPVSSTLRLEAARRQDRELNTNSGFPALLDWVGIQSSRSTEESSARFAAVCVRSVAEELVGTLKLQLRATVAVDGVDQVSVAHQAQRAADDLRRHSARWQNLLADEIANLVSDLEYDLRERTRKIVQITDRTFDEADPVKTWPEFREWLEDSLSDAVETNYRWLTDRAEWIAHLVAGTFVDVPEPDLGLADAHPGDGLDSVEEPRIERFKVSQKMFTGLRGSYGGLLMFGLVTSLAGLQLINPISVGAGAAFATKTIRDEGDARLKRRQAIAKSAAQRYVDDVFLRFSKECRDIVRSVQRQLRDHFAARTDQLVDDISRAREAMQTGAAQRDRRTLALKREIERLAELHGRAGALGVRAIEQAGRARELSA